MKKAVLLLGIIFTVVSLNSCKKLLNSDPISLLTKEPWIGDKYVTNHLPYDYSYAELEFDKNNKTYIWYEHGDMVDKGNWEYDEDSKILILTSDSSNETKKYEVLKLKKKKLVLDRKYEYLDESLSKIYFIR
jgi:hypothetical protein